ncbi:hypothetical protein H696_05688 [Fonticula alba]|uniref:Uncharacterized protein n=1 Tax=Fonticula alba TaxID=691883 RepID=A0A058Z0G4_FONAL|nr:hypothetical protein H696_05688 [Fonticula alba]KCV67750.1 hypothetical protein H696_05688 [Fonticula alba]|eukprot:XP_009497781.1 hypothetical protein H696_05688 [Fonticula alba]
MQTTYAWIALRTNLILYSLMGAAGLVGLIIILDTRSCRLFRASVVARSPAGRRGERLAPAPWGCAPLARLFARGRVHRSAEGARSEERARHDTALPG